MRLFQNASVRPAGVLKGGRVVIDTETKQVHEAVVDSLAASDPAWRALEEVCMSLAQPPFAPPPSLPLPTHPTFAVPGQVSQKSHTK